MSKKWPVGNCRPEEVELPEFCSVNTITKDNKIRNLMKNVPVELFSTNICNEQPVWQPVLNVGSNCKGGYMDRQLKWANLSPNQKGGYARVVQNEKKEQVVSVMGKIDIPNYFMPCSRN